MSSLRPDVIKQHLLNSTREFSSYAALSTKAGIMCSCPKRLALFGRVTVFSVGNSLALHYITSTRVMSLTWKVSAGAPFCVSDCACT